MCNTKQIVLIMIRCEFGLRQFTLFLKKKSKVMLKSYCMTILFVAVYKKPRSNYVSVCIHTW